MDLEQRLRASLVAPDPGAMFTARVMARLGRGSARRRNSFILMGTVLVVAAAAAMLVWLMTTAPWPPVENAAIPALSGPEDVVEEPVVQVIPQVSEPVEAASGPAALPAQPGDISPRYSVQVMPLRQEADVSKRGPVEALYAATLDELRKVPGLTLHVSGGSEPGADVQADYVLTITSLATRVSQSGGIVVRSADGTNDTVYDDGMVATFRTDGSGGGGGISSNGGGSGNLESAVWVEMRAETGQSAASRSSLPPGAGARTLTSYSSGVTVGMVNLVLNNRLSGFNVDIDYGPDEAGDGGNPSMTPAQPAAAQAKVLRVQLFAQDAANQQRCNGPNAVSTAECMPPAQHAATQVEILRLQVFPPDPAFLQSVVARLGDASQAQAGGLKALQDLLQGLTADGGSRLDAGTIHALVRYAAGQAAGPRMYVWNALRQVSHPALIAPLLESLRLDRDEQVRLAALANLDANYSSDPIVRSVFEEIGREDRDDIVRVAVRRALYGQAQWRDEVLAALQNTGLPYDARLAPLIATGTVLTPRQQGHRQAALQEQQVLRPLLTLVREHLQDPDHAKSTSEVLGRLFSVDDPAVFDLFMKVMRETPALKQEMTVQGNGISMSGPVSSWVFRHRTDPRVLESLSTLDPRLRTAFVAPQTTGSAVPVSQIDLTIIPSNLIDRIREVTKSPASPAPNAQ